MWVCLFSTKFIRKLLKGRAKVIDTARTQLHIATLQHCNTSNIKCIKELPIGGADVMGMVATHTATHCITL